MQDQYAIMTRGFRNILDNDAVTGYQINVRMPYYRGTFLSLVHYLDLVVDGHQIRHDDLRIIVAGRTFTIAEMEEADDVRWEFGAAATLRVNHAGGLISGGHSVQIGIVIRKSYLPAEDPEHLYDFFGLWKDGKYSTYIEPPTVITKRMTLVQ